MAGDWIKMRVWLSRDPRVIGMADFLCAEPRFLNPMGIGCVPEINDARRNVTVALCVTGLLVTWGTAREQGDREKDDLVVSHCRLSTLDAMTGLPFFGIAMAYVAWAEERADGALIFPKFFKDNESPDDRHKRQNADRQARFRANQSNAEVTIRSNVTVTDREEKRRVLKPIAPPPQKTGLAEPTPQHQALADELGVACKTEFAKYRDWLSASGRRQKDEHAGFRNWLRKAAEFRPKPPAAPVHGSHAPAKISDLGKHTDMPDKVRAQLAEFTRTKVVGG